MDLIEINDENCRLKNGLIATIKMRLAPDGFYGDALAPDENGDGQKILKLEVHLDGAVIAGAEAWYLAESHGYHLSMLNISVDPIWQRNGIAGALYDAVESHYGDTVLPYPGNEGGAIQHFWYDRLKDKPELLDRVKEDIGPLLSRLAAGVDQPASARSAKTCRP